MNLRHKIALAGLDYALAASSLLLALGLRLDFDCQAMERFLSSSHMWFYAGSSALVVLSFWLYGLYDKLWRYAGVHELLSVAGAACTALVPVEAFVLLGGGSVFPRTGPVIACFLWMALGGGLRFLLRLTGQKQVRRQPGGVKRAFILGANDCGEAVVRDLLRENSHWWPVGFLDDDPGKRSVKIHGVPILGNLEDLADLVEKHEVKGLVLADPTPSLVRQALQLATPLGLELRTVPGTGAVVQGAVKVNAIREVRIEDLLEREPVHYEGAKVKSYIEGKTVLVTGAGGSIGSEICRQVFKLGARQLILLGRGENSIYEIGLELKALGAPIISFICDVRDAARMRHMFVTYRPQVVFHAAAHKHVPLMEGNPAEAVSNNVFGTLRLLELAEEFNVEKLIFISTDKAVNPSSVMGATKRLAELLLARRRRAGFAAVRFGNVLGSRGSVIPTFKRQIAAGGPVTVTHADMTRFFMTIPEAVSLVLQAGAMADESLPGAIYILDMGKPVKIIDLARNLIRLSGFRPDVDIPIQVVGLRPGEKLSEQLVNSGEGTGPTSFAKITRVTAPPPAPDWPGEKLNELRAASQASDDEQTLRIMHELLPAFKTPELQ